MKCTKKWSQQCRERCRRGRSRRAW